MVGSTQVGNTVTKRRVTHQLRSRDGISYGTLAGLRIMELSIPTGRGFRRQTWVSIVMQPTGR